MSELELQRVAQSGAYARAERSSDYPLRRYTAFIRYNWGDGDDNSSIEEIDIDARDDTDARVIASAALAQDYEPGGRIIRVDERIGWYL